MTRNIVILTGSGVSAESGLGTFRDVDGIWSRFDWQTLATPEGFATRPDQVHEFYNLRRQALIEATHNAAHVALAELERSWPDDGEYLLVTQNIDHLHEQAGSKNLIHMHGELLKSRCAACGDVQVCQTDISIENVCQRCDHTGELRPHVVWFGEIPLGLERIYKALARCDLFVAIGTSGTVYPAAGFVQEALQAGADTIELSLEPGEISHLFDETRYGPATEVVPGWVKSFQG